MSLTCTRCNGTGFLNIEQVPEGIREQGPAAVRDWMEQRNLDIDLIDCVCHIAPPCGRCELLHDVQVCDCCGDGENWHGEPGQHYTVADPEGDDGPYRYNGGLCECH